ncbi:ATP-grasp domain-containing protein [Proteiniclasticum sp. QWL-01]|uniref:ATP-grasp domain-containing protein n=1 Tax=Proteiniclasticum sp. QWL-01 TaxID=3036945 RepID=UPI0024111773|nr:ATP-grasp domain-containing protein [Proteiniclasticum sp. QWL-01]WFF74412.1 ATP-grasp domain-containing protein [Proteiniclasticum sp. QWL-01]
MKRILLLGGSTQQVPAIEYANSQGYYTVLCDYLPDNPGQNYAKRFYCVSTTDKDAILEVAKNEKVDGIVAYASDPAAPTAAYVAEKLGLPTNPYKSVEILAFKDKFRQFLRENNFKCPKAKGFSSLESAKDEISQFTFPVMVKPIDSSGSKGVSKVEKLEDFEEAYKIALDNSRDKNIIVEEFIVQDHEFMIGGDCFVLNGKVVYWGLLNCHRDPKVNTLVPVGKSYPLLISESRIHKVKEEIQKVVDILNIKFGGFNLEVMIDERDRVFLIEMGPRNGGNMIPDLLRIINNVDLIGGTVETSIGNNSLTLDAEVNPGFYATHNIHTDNNGSFIDIRYKNRIEDKIIKRVIYKKKGDSVQYFDAANKAIGILFVKFQTQEEQMEFVSNPEKWIEVIVE